MTGPKRKPEADDEVRKVMARARKFLAARGVDCAVPIHREDAARFMVEFARLEKEFSEQMKSARKVMDGRHERYENLQTLSDSSPFLKAFLRRKGYGTMQLRRSGPMISSGELLSRPFKISLD